MKLVIDIPDKDYEFIKDLQSLIIGSRGNCRNIQYNVINAIKNGTPYEERPKGKWIEVDVRNCHATLKCSVCDRVIEPTFNFGEYSYEDIKTFYPYCHCGADMRGDV